MRVKSILLAFVMLIVFSGLVSAQSYQVTDIDINGVDMSDGVTAQVELGEDTKVVVDFTGTDYVDDVKVKAWIGGYEHGDVEDTSDIFDVEPNVTYSKTLYLNIPEDMDVDDNDFTLYVEVYDDVDSDMYGFSVYVEQQRHSLDIYDVIYDTILNDNDVVEIRVENNGERKEEDIKVELTIGAFSTSTYIDELAASPEDSNEDEEDSQSISFLLDLEGFETGYYDMEIDVTYNRGHDDVEHVYTVYVEGEEEEEVEDVEEVDDGEVLVNIAGSDLAYELTFTNSKITSEVFAIDVLGEDQWASAEYDSMVVVGAGESEVLDLTLVADEGASGEQEFTIQILESDGGLLEEVTLEVEVENENNWFESSSLWKWFFIVLVVLIVLIVLILVIRGAGGGSDDDDELELKDGKTYY
tara:strand:+ start:1403 stop:2638 length:1236 start_codon:yes stop_codon:yes gene_type:complete